MDNPNRTSRKEFLNKYAEYFKAGRTRQELAEELGIKVDSIYSRVQVEKRRGNPMPLIPLEPRGHNDEEVRGVLDELASLANGKHVAEVTEEKPDGAPLSEDDIDALLS